MKRLFLIFLILIGFLEISSAQEHRRYALIWHDEFDAGVLDTTVWSKIPRGKADWAVHMSPDERLYAFDKGNLVLRGMVNDFLPNDKAPFLTGGVWGKGKKTFGFGKIEVRAKFDVAQGFWPAIWMLPWTNHTLNWPQGGEIDIMEHFGESPYVNNTVHSHYTINLGRRRRPPQVAYPNYNIGQYNTYGVERFQDSLVFFVNGRRSMNYPRFRKGNNGQFPFSEHDFYMILDAQIGHDGSPYIDTAKLPVELRVDYVRYYELDTKTDVVPEPKDYQQLGERRFRFKKVTVNDKEHFDNPDEYHVVVKRGKAKVSGNLEWAQSTLTQLIGEDGKIVNLEVHDWAACPYRGVALSENAVLTYETMMALLDKMAFYKLNYLQWNGKADCSEEEANIIREHALELGIQLVGDRNGNAGLDVLVAKGQGKVSASDGIFLHEAASKGGILTLEGIDGASIDAMMAFAERYWRGGNAGEGTDKNGVPEAMSPAASRLANFKEKVVLQKSRFNKK